MFLYLSAPGSGEEMLILFVIGLFITVPIIAYYFGFRNGKREGERLQLQKQMDKISKNK
jgi:ABC-type cobalt transport system substrate-binding protein